MVRQTTAARGPHLQVPYVDDTLETRIVDVL
jgi:hypothetical protein